MLVVFANTPLNNGRNASTGNLQTLYRNAIRSEGNKSNGMGHAARLGVYTLTVRLPSSNMDDRRRENLGEIMARCLHNASVCARTGDTEKEGVWKLLAETVERQIEEIDGRQAFSGWGGNGGGALGVELVGNLMKYYESLGDCQMLATMACVLSGGRRSALRREKSKASDESRPYLLPLDQDEKYDSYIRKYADLLYEWGLLTRRAEVTKHLVRVPVEDGVSPTSSSSTDKPRNAPAVFPMASTEGRQPGIAIAFQCFRCGNDTDLNSNVCRNCHDFAFRCSICDIAVRGLLTVCDKCNHGGHMSHMIMWFSEHVECPTGCGCTCILSTRKSSEGDEANSTLMKIENDPVI